MNKWQIRNLKTDITSTVPTDRVMDIIRFLEAAVMHTTDETLDWIDIKSYLNGDLDGKQGSFLFTLMNSDSGAEEELELTWEKE